MILECKDFVFDNRALEAQGYMSVNFDEDEDLPASLVRNLEVSEMTQYRPETNGYGMTYSEVLEFDIHIMKDECKLDSQDDLKFTDQEYDECVAWLTSPRNHTWMTVTMLNGNKTMVKGYFSSVTAFAVGMKCYGVRATFTCNSPYSFNKKTYEFEVAGNTELTIQDNTSERYDYVYPTMVITPTENEDIFIHNIADSQILDSGTLLETNKMADLKNKIETFAAINNYQLSYALDEDGNEKHLCNDTVIPFYLTTNYGVETKTFAYYDPNTSEYRIAQGGFFYCSTLKQLVITIDCKTMSLYDSLSRPVLFEQVGIQDEDAIYWLRFVYGENKLAVRGNFNINIQFLEPKKGMLV